MRESGPHPSNIYIYTHLAGILLSSMISPIWEELTFNFLDWTFTVIRAGFRSPTLTSSERASASVIVALKRPVRRCFGRWVTMRVMAAWKPRSNNLRKLIRKRSTRNWSDLTYLLHLTPGLLILLHSPNFDLCPGGTPRSYLEFQSRCQRRWR